jgi:hypothetical protein
LFEDSAKCGGSFTAVFWAYSVFETHRDAADSHIAGSDKNRRKIRAIGGNIKHGCQHRKVGLRGAIHE